MKLKKGTKKALENFRMEKARALQQGSLIYGLEAAVFGDTSLDKVVKGMKTITVGDDVIDLCDGMIHNFADKVADIICDMKEKDMAASVKETREPRKRGAKNKKDVNPDFEKGLVTWRMPK